MTDFLQLLFSGLATGAIYGLAALGLFPVLVPNPYYIHLVETILIYAILLFGLDIVVGYTGQVSLGHAGLFGVGSYTAGVLFFKLGLPFVLAVLWWAWADWSGHTKKKTMQRENRRRDERIERNRVAMGTPKKGGKR